MPEIGETQAMNARCLVATPRSMGFRTLRGARLWKIQPKALRLKLSLLSPRVALDAYYKFLSDDGWAIASHIALSALMALFPFLIVITALAGFFGSKELAHQAATLLFDAWPHRVADTLSGEIHDVLTNSRGDILTLGAV